MPTFSMQHFLWDVHLEGDNGSIWEVKMGSHPWVLPIGILILFLFLALVLFLNGGPWLGSVLLLILAGCCGAGYPLNAEMTVDFPARQVNFKADYLFRWSERQVRRQIPFGELVEVNPVKVWGSSARRVDFILADGTRIISVFNRKAVGLDPFVQQLQAERGSLSDPGKRLDIQNLLVHELRFWGSWILVMAVVFWFIGGFSFFPGFSVLVGIEVAVIGITAFYFQVPAMFLVCGAFLVKSVLITSAFGSNAFVWMLVPMGVALLLFREFYWFNQQERAAANSGEVWVTLQRGQALFSSLAFRLSLIGLVISAYAAYDMWNTRVHGSNGLFAIAGLATLFLFLIGLNLSSWGFIWGLGAWIGGYGKRSFAIAACAMSVVPWILLFFPKG